MNPIKKERDKPLFFIGLLCENGYHSQLPHLSEEFRTCSWRIRFSLCSRVIAGLRRL